MTVYTFLIITNILLQDKIEGSPPSVIGDLSSILVIMFWPQVLSFDFERKWWMLSQKCTVCTKFDIYVFVNENTLFSLHEHVMMLHAN